MFFGELPVYIFCKTENHDEKYEIDQDNRNLRRLKSGQEEKEETALIKSDFLQQKHQIRK